MHRKSMPELGKPLVEIKNAFLTLSTIPVLDDVSLIIRKGEHLVIEGGNGAGKSTLLRVVRGEQWLDQIRDAITGTISYRGEVIWHTDAGAENSALAGRKITALVSSAQQEKIERQQWHILGRELVLGGFTDTAFLHMQHCHPEKAELAQKTIQMLGAEDLPDRPVAALSQGQLRLLLVARALVRQSPLLLLDEVTEGLDHDARNRLLAALEQAAELSTLVMTTHRPETLPAWVRKHVKMNHGHLSDHPLPAEHQKKQESPKTLAWHPGGVGISLEHVTVYIDSEIILQNITWQIKPGENWAILGNNGTGKSTLLRLLAGDEFVAAGGKISYVFPKRDLPVQRDNLKLEDLRKAVHLVSDRQQAEYGYNITGAELVFSGFDNSVGVYRDATDTEKEQVQTLLHLVDAEKFAQQPLRSCSSGELRRLLLARALAGEPDLLLLDEPFSGLDNESRTSLTALLEEIAQDGLQIVLVTHHPGDMLSVIKHSLTLQNGQIVAE